MDREVGDLTGILAKTKEPMGLSGSNRERVEIKGLKTIFTGNGRKCAGD